jgi:uncharacterized protein YqfA (UPF0365 family)
MAFRSGVEKVMAAAQVAGAPVSTADVCTHLLCKGSVEKVVEALALAAREGIPASWHELCTIDLATAGGKVDVIGVVRESMQVKEMTFSTFMADSKEPLCGVCRDGTRVKAQCHISYRLPMSHVFGTCMGFLQERLAARICAGTFDAGDAVGLQMARTEHEASLLVLAKAVMPTVLRLELEYEIAD